MPSTAAVGSASRPPPAPADAELPTLWHFRLSHYNEKARWALDWKRLPHRRHAVIPGPHVPIIRWHTGQQQVPVLRIDGETITDSTRIIAALEARHPDPPLYPADPTERARALALEDHFDEELGPHIRRALFYDLLQDSDAAIGTLTVGESALTRSLYRLAFPFVRAFMRYDMGIDAERAARSRAVVMASLDRLEAELRPSGYLVGDAFSVADLTAAALFAPLTRANEFPYRLPPLVPALAEWRAALADRPGFRWALDMYRRHRGVSAAVSG
jgi:glutathione S-transferase